jgi:hypothetical protein
MKKGIWTLIMPSVPATSWSGYRWAGSAWEEVWEEVWEQVWDTGGEEKGEGVAGAEGKAGSFGS